MFTRLKHAVRVPAFDVELECFFHGNL
jgi:hypothetical protein